MRPRRLVLLVFGAILCLPHLDGGAQLRLQPVSEEAGHVGLGLALRKLSTVGIFMHTAAHPDDENNGLLAMFSHGKGYRTVLASATRGEGGQNEIGPELFDALAVLRTEELLAAHRFDGAEQLFGRAVDFGYSFSVEETFQKWGRREILGDFVRLIRAVRPDVIVSLPAEGAGGGLHHQASAILTGEAFRLAADPSQFPEQIEAGLRPWQPRKLYTLASFGFRGEPAPPPGVRLVAVNTAVLDPLLGRTYLEVGTEGRSMHKCQGMAQLLALPAVQAARYRLADTTIAGQRDRDEATLFDGLDTTIEGLAQYGGGAAAPPGLTSGLASVARAVEAAWKGFESGGPPAALAPLASGLVAVRQLRAALGSMSLPEDGRFEIDLRLDAKERQFQDALVLAAGLRFEALADDGLVIGGQPVRLTTIAANRGTAGVAVRRVTATGFEGAPGDCARGELAPSGILSCESTMTVPAGLEPTGVYWRRLADAARYEIDPAVPFGAPFRPTPFRVGFEAEIAGAPVVVDLPVQHRYQGDIFAGEKRMELKVVPRFAVRATPDIAVLPLPEIGQTAPAAPGAGPRGEREVRVTVTNNAKGPAGGEAALAVPAGWTASPARLPVAFTREGEEQTVRFRIRPPAAGAAGDYRIRAVVSAAGEQYGRGYQVVEYPHIRRRHLVTSPEPTVKVMDVRVAPGLLVGYVMGVGDQVPGAIEQLGARVELVGPDELAWGDLSRYHVIMTGVRAYERRDDLRAHNERLIKYAEDGGTVLVQYNKFEFNEAQYGPLPAKVSSNRVTDEASPVRLLAPEHPVFTSPNRVDEAAWRGWVQERGLYFLGEKDARYADLVEMEDTFEYNKGPKRGALVEARVGKGRWLYVGLGLWRQLPAGTNGAYPLLANLLSLGSRSAAGTQANR